MHSVNVRDHLIGALIGLVYLLTLMATASDLAMSRDESFYVDASQLYVQWIELFSKEPKVAMAQAHVDRFWTYNHEHPALMKSLAGILWRAHAKWKLFSADSLAFRFPTMVCSSLLLWLLYIFGTRLHGRFVGAVAAIGFASLPRIFYHAHLHTFDLPITFFILLTVYCYWRSLDNVRWGLWTGLAYGLALATKHNSWLLPIILMIHWAWFRTAQPERKRTWVERFPVGLAAMVTLAPVIWIMSWPWLWHDTFSRIGGYINFHTHHAQSHGVVNVEYLGKNLFAPPFPMSVPFVLTAFTVPLTFLALSLYGIRTRFRYVLPQWVAKRFRHSSEYQGDVRYGDVLVFGCFLAPLVVIAFPNTPKFGGTKHWFPAYPFMAIYFGIGVQCLLQNTYSVVNRCKPNLTKLLPVGVASLCLAPSMVETVHSHPLALSHYTSLAGGVSGAADRGMNRQFWGFTTGSVVEFLTKRMPQGGKVWLCDTTYGAWHMLQRDGKVSMNIQPTHEMSNADYILVHHELHFAEVDFQAWVTLGTTQPVYVLTYDGVPIVSIYARKTAR